MKRFYKDAAAAPTPDGGWQVLLDSRPVKTAGGRLQVVPGQPLAEALAGEWAAQGETIAASSFAFRDLADFAIDAVAPDQARTAQDLMPYAETDTLCYRADPEDALFTRQQEIWEPLLCEAESARGIRFRRISGIVHQPQPPETLSRLATELAGHDAFTLASLRMLSSLSASLVIALAAIAPGADAERLWNAANLEEDWQAELWGSDHEAAAHRQQRFAAFQLAIEFAQLARRG